MGSPGHVARAVAVVVATVTAAALVVLGYAVGASQMPGSWLVLMSGIALAFTPMGALVLVGVPGHPVGRFMVTAGAVAGVSALAGSWGRLWPPAAWLGQWLWWPPFGLIFAALLVFPDGRLVSRRWRSLRVTVLTATALAGLALAGAAIDHPFDAITSIDHQLSGRAVVLLRVAAAAMVVTGIGFVGVLLSLWRRWRRAQGEVRYQLACLLPAGGLLVLGLVLDALNVSGVWMVTAAGVPVAMTVAVLKYRLYDLDRVISRTVVWSVMTVLVVVAFVIIVAAVRGVFVGSSASQASLGATGLIAVAFQPACHRVQRAVNRLIYGDRDDPYRVVARLGELIGQTVEPFAVLPLLARTIAGSLQVPYVAVELGDDGEPRIEAEYGSPSTTVEAFCLIVHGGQVGRLLVGTRTAAAHFTSREVRLLRDVAQHAAVAVEATRLTRDLQRSREHLVLAREEERRRLRRDLHDGVGPSLAGMSMQIRAAQKLNPEPSRVGGILTAVTEDLRLCTAEVRQLVDQLRPPALDNGLTSALRAMCDRFQTASLSVRLRVDDDLLDLPAAVEVAVYRIVAEALTNVARHSEAGDCTVTLHRTTALAVEIVDDGVGIHPGDHRAGVGLGSIRERTAELGGQCAITGLVPSGTTVTVRLPLTAAVPS